MDKTWAVIPVKSLQAGKSRLTAVLQPTERAALTQQLLQRTLAVLQAAGIGQTVVVSRDTAVQQLAQAQGSLVLAEAESAGMNGAIQEGVCLATLAGAEQVLILPSDLPFLTAVEVQALFEPSSPHQVTLCPDRHEQGTNGLLLPTTIAFPFQFGEGSLAKHVAAGYGRWGVRLVRMAGWQFDLDTAVDWQIYQQALVNVPSSS